MGIPGFLAGCVESVFFFSTCLITSPKSRVVSLKGKQGAKAGSVVSKILILSCAYEKLLQQIIQNTVFHQKVKDGTSNFFFKLLPELNKCINKYKTIS
jgi:hypothetical protein